MKKLIFIFVFATAVNRIGAQLLYSNHFNNLALTTYTNATVSCQYTTAPTSFTLLNDGYNNNVGNNFNPNSPFFVPALKTAGWVVAYNSYVNDTFLVSTSWLDDATQTCNRWIVTPSVNVTPNTVLTWMAMSPDATNPDGYEVYATDKTGILTADTFHIGDRFFSLPDGNTTGGGEKKTWTRRSIDFSSQAGKNLRFAFRNNSKNMFQLWIDDIEVRTLAHSLDAAPVEFKSPKYFLTNTAQTVSVSIINNGASTITAVSLSYKWGNSTPETQTFSVSGDLSYGQSAIVSFPIQYTASSAGNYPLKIWVNSVNGATDQDKTNDTLKTYITAMNSAPQKNVMLEQFLSASHGDGPDSQDKGLALQSSSVIVVNIHDNDSLKENNSSVFLNTYRRAFSTGLVNRMNFNDSVVFPRTSFTKHINEELSSVTPASVSIISKNYDPFTGVVQVAVTAGFAGDVRGDFRMDVYLVENHVYGPLSDTTVNGYNQFNNYYFLPWSPWYLQGYYSNQYGQYILDANKFKHQNVLVHAFDGSFGSSGIIPQNGGTAAQTYTQAFNWTIPAPSNGVHKYFPDNMYLVAFVSEYNADYKQRTVLNVVKEKLTNNPEAVGVRENASNPKFSFYPNPSSGRVYFTHPEAYNLKVTVTDVNGKQVRNLELNSQTSEADFSNLASGVYILHMKGSQGDSYQKLIIQR